MRKEQVTEFADSPEHTQGPRLKGLTTLHSTQRHREALTQKPFPDLPLKKKKFVELIVSVSGVQQSDSAIFHTLCYYINSLLQDIEYNSLCCRV